MVGCKKIGSENLGLDVPLANATDNITVRDVIGNKTDAAVIAVGVANSEVAYLKGILTQVNKILGDAYSVEVYGPQFLDVDNVGRFEAVIMDSNTGLVPLADITAGTYDIIRTRAGVDTTIVNDAAWSKANGKVYCDYTFAAASWAVDDTFKVVPNGDTTVSISGTTYYIPIPTMSGYVGNGSSVETKLDTANTNIGSPSTRTNLKSLEAMLGNPDAVGATIYGNIGDFVAQANLKSVLAALGIPDVAGKPLYTCLITDRLDDVNFGLSALNTDLDAILADIGDASASTLGSVLAIIGNPGTDSLSVQLGADGIDSIATQIGANGLDSIATQIGCSGLQSVNLQLGYGAAGSVVTDFSTNRTALETASLVAGAGSLADNAREGLLLRYTADTADTIMDNIGTIANSGALADTLAATLGDFVGTDLVTRLTNINTAVTDVNTDLGNFSGQANLQSALAALGIPDVAGKSLYVCLITDRLDSATFGLSALNTDLDAILADIGDASGATLGSILAIIGNPGTDSLSTQLGADGLDSIATQIGCDGVQSVNLQLGYGAASSVSADATILKTNLGDPSGDTLISIAAKLGDDASTVKARFDTLDGSFTTVTGLFDVPLADSAANTTMRDVIGNKTDTVAGDSVIALLKQDLVAVAAIQSDIGDPSSRTNLKSIEAMIGAPDAPASSIYDLMAKEATIGAPVSLLGTVCGDIADVAAQIAALVVPDAAGTAAGLLAVPVADSALNVIATDVVGNKTDTVAGDSLVALSKQNKASLAVLPSNAVAEAESTYTYITPWTDEQTVYELTTTKRHEIKQFYLNMSNITQTGTVRIYTKIKGSGYLQIVADQIFNPATDGDVFWWMNKIFINGDLKITYQASVSETANRDIDCVVFYQQIEA